VTGAIGRLRADNWYKYNFPKSLLTSPRNICTSRVSKIEQRGRIVGPESRKMGLVIKSVVRTTLFRAIFE
jgi:hypothetical protein